MKRLLLSVFALAVVGCGGMMASEMAKPKDGQLAFPADYKSWPKFLTGVQKAEAKQVRDLYINTTGARASQGQSFANGTTMVMELYKATEKDGALETGPDGKLVKGALAKIFVSSTGTTNTSRSAGGCNTKDRSELRPGANVRPQPTHPERDRDASARLRHRQVWIAGALALPGHTVTSLLILASIWGILMPALMQLKNRMGLQTLQS